MQYMNKRLEYIDLAKGIGIIFIIVYHLRILPPYLPHLSGACVPLFFILSGLFFRHTEDFKSFAIKKVNTILVPFVFFYTIPYILFYVLESLCPGLIKTQATGLLDVFTQDDYFNGPIWFLLSLFWDFIILWGIFNLTKSNILTFIGVSVISIFGLILSKYGIFLPLKLAPAFSCLIFLYFGYVFKNWGALDVESRKLSTLLSIGFFSFSVGLNHYFSPLYMELYNNTIVGNVVANYMIVISFSLGVFYGCKTIGSLPFFSYFGKYSLIPLCLHHLVYRPILLFCNALPAPPFNSRYIVAIMTIIVLWVLMPLCLKMLPWFCGKRSLIKFESNYK